MNEELFRVIESYEYSAQLNVVSGYAQFLRALGESQQVRTLLTASCTREDETLNIFYRLLDLMSAPYDSGYENPADVAVAAYLLVLYLTDHDLAMLATERVLDGEGFWWARKLAQAAHAVREPRTANVYVGWEDPPTLRARARPSRTADAVFLYIGAHGDRPLTRPNVRRSVGFGPTLGNIRVSQRNRGSGNHSASVDGGANRNRGTTNMRHVLEAVA